MNIYVRVIFQSEGQDSFLCQFAIVKMRKRVSTSIPPAPFRFIRALITINVARPRRLTDCTYTQVITHTHTHTGNLNNNMKKKGSVYFSTSCCAALFHPPPLTRPRSNRVHISTTATTRKVPLCVVYNKQTTHFFFFVIVCFVSAASALQLLNCCCCLCSGREFKRNENKKLVFRLMESSLNGSTIRDAMLDMTSSSVERQT